MLRRRKRIDDIQMELYNENARLTALEGYIPEYEMYKKKVDSFEKILANQEMEIEELERRVRNYDR